MIERAASRGAMEEWKNGRLEVRNIKLVQRSNNRRELKVSIA